VSFCPSVCLSFDSSSTWCLLAIDWCLPLAAAWAWAADIVIAVGTRALDAARISAVIWEEQCGLVCTGISVLKALALSICGDDLNGHIIKSPLSGGVAGNTVVLYGL